MRTTKKLAEGFSIFDNYDCEIDFLNQRICVKILNDYPSTDEIKLLEDYGWCHNTYDTQSWYWNSH